MEGKVHVPVGFVSCLVVYVFTYIYYENGDTFSLAFFGIFGSLLPDLDQLYGRHRDFWTHSAILPLIGVIYMLGWNFDRYYDVFYITLGVGFHLLFDLKLKKEGKMGTYCIVKPVIVIRKKEGKKKLGKDCMTAKNSDRWIIANMLACFVTCFLLYVSF